jgi:ABC-2 type transport system ATP-binding protein
LSLTILGIIRNGELVALEEVEDLKARAIPSLEIQFSQIPSEEQFKNLPGVEEISLDGSRLRCKVVGKLDRLIKEAANYEIVDITSNEQTLEQIFLKYYNQQEQELEGEKSA